jgi:predicted Rdx family selenoprotein
MIGIRKDRCRRFSEANSLRQAVRDATVPELDLVVMKR